MNTSKLVARIAAACCASAATAQCQPAWSTLGATDGIIESLVPFDDGTGLSLYAGGTFGVIDGTSAQSIARWKNGHWYAVGGGLGDGDAQAEVAAMVVYDADGKGPGRPVLVVGGSFIRAGAVAARSVAAWDGAAWTALPGGPDGSVLSMAVYDDDGPGPHAALLVVGGSFYTVSGQPAAFTASWNGATWSTTYSNLGSWGWSLCPYADQPGNPDAATLYAGSYMHVSRFDGHAWSIYGGNISGAEPRVRAMAVFDDDGAGPRRSGLYVLGDFNAAGTVPAKGIARWDGQQWEGLGAGLTASGTAATSFDAVVHDDGNGPALYAAGWFNRAGGNVVSNVAKWNGTQWSSIGASFSQPVYRLLSFDEDGAGPIPAALIAGSVEVRRWGCVTCYANCDNSTSAPILSANDFQCFINRFMVADSYANCDGSTAAPVLNANDFQCFLNKFAAGCI